MGLIRFLISVGLAASASLWEQKTDTLERVSVDQVAGDTAGLKIYADIRMTGGAAATALPLDSTQVQVGGANARGIALKPFDTTGEGVAYVLAVDVSRSVTPALFHSLQDEIRSFADRLRPVDRAAILTFGDDTQLVTPFTGDKDALKAAASSLVPKAQNTRLNLGLMEALRLARRQEKDLPVRRAIVILTDGKDEGSGITADDVLHGNETNRIPIYSVGASELPVAERARYLDVLRRFSVLSGGEYFAVTTPSASGAYVLIQERVMRVWEATVDCSACPADGRVYPLQFTVSRNGATLTDRLNVIVTRPPPVPPTVQSQANRNLWYYGGGGAAVLLALVAFVILRRRRKAGAGGDSLSILPEPEPGLPEPVPPPPMFDGVVTEPTRPVATGGLKIELTRRGHPAGRFEATLFDQLVAGRSSEAGLRVPENGISARHCMIELVEGRVLVSDLGSTHGTSVNGVPIKGRQRVETGDSITLGAIEFNLRIQECR